MCKGPIWSNDACFVCVIKCNIVFILKTVIPSIDQE